MAKKQAIKSIKTALGVSKKTTKSGPAKGTGNARKRTGANRKAVSREGFDPAKAQASKAKGVTVTEIKKPLTAAQRKTNDAAAKAGKPISASPKVDTPKKVPKKTPVKKAVKTPVKKAVKKTPVKKAVKKTPVKKAAAKKAYKKCKEGC